MTVNWTGGDPNGWVEIRISEVTDVEIESSVQVDAVCYARTSVGTFTVPPAVLLALPPSSAGSGATVNVQAFSPGTEFQTAGMDLGLMTLGNRNVITLVTIR